MANFIIGERVVNKLSQIGTIISFDETYIYVNYADRTAKLRTNAFEEGYIKYENAELQNQVDEEIKKLKDIERQKEEKKRVLEENNSKLPPQQPLQRYLDIKYESVNVRLESAPISFGPTRNGDKDLIKKVFEECDKNTEKLYECFKPKMEYPKNTSQARSKYCVGFLCKHSDLYVLRVFSRNDVYKKRVKTGITVMKSDTTEILRAISVNGKDYYFSKNLGYCMGYVNNSQNNKKWHISGLGSEVLLNEVIRSCDCGYLNDYISEKNIGFSQYTKLLFPALHDNKAEIVFKNKLFTSVYRIDNIIEYLKPFSSKQIDFACKNDVINTLPIIKHCGNVEIDVLHSLEPLMKKRAYYGSIYDNLVAIFKRKNFNSEKLVEKMVRFVKKIDYLDATMYGDYVNLLYAREDISVDDFFDKNYIERHDIMMLEKQLRYDEESNIKYIEVAKKLSWIDREENGYFVMVPKTIEEFKHEGRLQHNCVYTNAYFNSVIEQSSVIVFLRKEKETPFVTIEFDYETFDILQARGKYNARIDNTLYKFIENLGKTLYYERKTQE